MSGQADIVEFSPAPSGSAGVAFAKRRGLWRPYPVEYKRSRDKAGSAAYRLQLCAQAMCLEEMLQVSIPEGAVYDGSTRRRQIVLLNQTLRQAVEELALRMHNLFAARQTPAPVLKKACRSCSLAQACMPEKLAAFPSVASYCHRSLAEVSG